MSAWQQITDAVTSDFADFGEIGAAARVVFRLLLACLLGGIIGFEREAAGKAAGIRTHMLVALGATLFVLAPLEHGVSDNALARIIQGLVAGIGFLGAGAIVKGRPGEEVEGLTTAASIWTTAALGMTVGIGRASTAVVIAVLALAIMHVMRSAMFAGPANKSADKKSARPPTRGDDHS